MGSGKSTAGKRLALQLGFPFIDLDKKIEEIYGMTIPEIFTLHGEDYFRKIESETLRNLLTSQGTVISAGGGTPCFDDNMEFMIRTGVTVYLRLTPGQLKSRIEGSTDQRPLIKDLKGDNLLKYIEEKLSFRESWYNRAEIITDGFNLDVNFLQNLIKSKLKI